jgi:hypothetical protein
MLTATKLKMALFLNNYQLILKPYHLNVIGFFLQGKNRKSVLVIPLSALLVGKLGLGACHHPHFVEDL